MTSAADVAVAEADGMSRDVAEDRRLADQAREGELTPWEMSAQLAVELLPDETLTRSMNTSWWRDRRPLADSSSEGRSM